MGAILIVVVGTLAAVSLWAVLAVLVGAPRGWQDDHGHISGGGGR